MTKNDSNKTAPMPAGDQALNECISYLVSGTADFAGLPEQSSVHFKKLVERTISANSASIDSLRQMINDQAQFIIELEKAADAALKNEHDEYKHHEEQAEYWKTRALRAEGLLEQPSSVTSVVTYLRSVGKVYEANQLAPK